MKTLLFWGTIFLAWLPLMSQQATANMRNPKNIPRNDLLEALKLEAANINTQHMPLPKDLSLFLLKNLPVKSEPSLNRPVSGVPSAGQVHKHGGPQQAQATRQRPVFYAAPPRFIASDNTHVDFEDHKEGNEQWLAGPPPEIAKIVRLDVKCEKNAMKVSMEFDKPFNGVIFSKGHYSLRNCVYLTPNSGRKNVFFDVAINSCGTTGNTNGVFFNEDTNTDSGTYFENTLVVQYDPQVQEAWDQARRLRCTWHDQYEKAVSFRPFPVDMLDVVKADFAGDNVGCWMQIQVGKGPWASEVAGIVKIGQTMTMVLAIKDEENKFDMLVRNCIAHDGKRAPIELVDGSGCVMRPKLMSKFTKIKNFGSSASVLSYTHFQAFKFPDSMEVHFQCTIQICRHQCPDQCSQQPGSEVVSLYNDINDAARKKRDTQEFVVSGKLNQQGVGVNKVIQVVSTRDLTFPVDGDETPMSLVSQNITKSDVNRVCVPIVQFTIFVLFILSVSVFCALFVLFKLRKRGSKKKCAKTWKMGTASLVSRFPTMYTMSYK